MNYLEYLKTNRELKQREIESIMERYKTEPVGTGYIDIITPNKYIDEFIEEITNINVAIECVTWWCHCSDTNEKQYGCPHGMGGPKSDYYDGWYSEMGFEFETFEIPSDKFQKLDPDENLYENIKTINELIREYVMDLSKARGYSKCLTPAFWLRVPEEWERINYMKD